MDTFIKRHDHKHAYRKVLVMVYLESGCSIDEGEYSLEIEWSNEGIVKDDFDLIEQCIADNIDDLGIKEEQPTLIMLYESGEWEDVFWHKYYEIEHVSIHTLPSE